MENQTYHRKESNGLGNSRANIRMPIAAVAHLTPQGEETTTRVFVRDISIFGLGGISIHPYNKGDRVRVDIEVATSVTKVLKGLIDGNVRWSKKEGDQEKYMFGIEFIDIKAQEPRLFAGLQALEMAYS